MVKSILTALLVLGSVAYAEPKRGASVGFVEGHTVVPGTWEWDLEQNALGSCDPDFWWERFDDKEAHLVAVPGVKVAVVPNADYDEIGYTFLKSFPFADENPDLTNRGDKLALSPGTVLAVKTSKGHYAKMRVMGYVDSHKESFAGSAILMPFIKILKTKPELKNYHIALDWALYGSDKTPSTELTVVSKECGEAKKSAAAHRAVEARTPASRTQEPVDIKGPKVKNVGVEVLTK